MKILLNITGNIKAFEKFCKESNINFAKSNDKYEVDVEHVIALLKGEKPNGFSISYKAQDSVNDAETTLMPDDHGIAVTLKNVDMQDIKALKSHDISPIDSSVNKYYAYHDDIGFCINEDHFDYAMKQGRKLSYDEYLSILRGNSMSDAIYAKDAIDASEKAEVNERIEAVKSFIDKPYSKIASAKNAKDITDSLKLLMSIMKDDEASYSPSMNDAIAYEIDANKKANAIANDFEKMHEDKELRRWIFWHKKEILALESKTRQN